MFSNERMIFKVSCCGGISIWEVKNKWSCISVADFWNELMQAFLQKFLFWDWFWQEYHRKDLLIVDIHDIMAKAYTECHMKTYI